MVEDYYSTILGGEVDTEALKAPLAQAFTHMTISRYLTLIGFVLLLYDHLLTLPEEISVIWKRQKSTVSWIFLVNRYTVPFVLGIDVYDKAGLSNGLSTQFCQVWMALENHIHLLSHASIHALVALRVSAIWSHQPRVKWSVAFAWGLYFVVNMSLGSYAVIQSHRTFHFDSVMQVCFGTIPWFTYWIWVPPLLIEAFLFTLTVMRARQQVKQSVKVMPFAYILYRDGFIYFMIISCCSIFNLVVWEAAPPTLVAIAKYFTFGLVNVTAARMVLNLRSHGDVTAYDHDDGTYFIDAITQGNIDDAETDNNEIENQLQVQVKRLRSLKISRPVVPVTTSNSVLPTQGGQFDMEMWQRSLPSTTAHPHLRLPLSPSAAQSATYYDGFSSKITNVEIASLSSSNLDGGGSGSTHEPHWKI